MRTVFARDVASFLTSLTAYVVVGVFLAATGLLLFFLPDFSLLDAGYANLDGLFALAPWLFLFLVPATTMRLLSEERRTGTLELLFTRPVSEFGIVLGKFFAGLFLVILALVPTLVYLYTIDRLGDPPGNFDLGGTLGSYIGLLLLAAAFVAIGLFASSLSSNVIVAFLLGVGLCFLFYSAFDALSALPGLGYRTAGILEAVGIATHYRSVSRGVLYLRDIVYYVSLILAFLVATATVLSSRKW